MAAPASSQRGSNKGRDAQNEREAEQEMSKSRRRFLEVDCLYKAPASEVVRQRLLP